MSSEGLSCSTDRNIHLHTCLHQEGESQAWAHSRQYAARPAGRQTAPQCLKEQFSEKGRLHTKLLQGRLAGQYCSSVLDK